jgi:hypothetical protein
LQSVLDCSILDMPNINQRSALSWSRIVDSIAKQIGEGA